ncbi:MAG: glycoside hydrolase family 5 protein [Candidatus Symbiothrix sp.]|jgi:aryl-phospho-beta-D-glucosidase BglC (GH1 family)|nr:glycoside hydrolase family 5 protein [Candidatus Symbiothrix sp.]
MKRFFYFIAAICAASLFSAMPVVAQEEASRFVSENFSPTTTYYVAETGADAVGNGTATKPFKTIKYAIENTPVAGGHAIVVKSGTYTGGYITTKFESPVLVKAEVPYKAILKNSASHRAAYLDRAENIIISGFEITGNKSYPLGNGSTSAYVFQIDMCKNIVLENNILHDSYNNDILKLNNRSQSCVVRGNIFYNQNDYGGDEHIDANVLYDAIIEDNIFFNDYAASGRSCANKSQPFVLVKSSGLQSSGKPEDASRNISIARNVFLNWWGATDQSFLLLGEDGQNFFEVSNVMVENNLFIHNETKTAAPKVNRMSGTWSIKGVKDITFRSNTVTGFIQHSWDTKNATSDGFGYALRVGHESQNLNNENITIVNNIFSDPTGNMGEISGGNSQYLVNGKIDNNLFFNTGNAIRDNAAHGFTISLDQHAIIADPEIEKNLSGVTTPVWSASTNKIGGQSTSIEEARLALVAKYATPQSATSPLIGKADKTNLPERDITYNLRSSDIGAYEFSTPPKTTDTISAQEVVEKIKVGWNLGNTLDACDYKKVGIDAVDNSAVERYEKLWQNPVTTQEMIDVVKNAGFGAVRVPVTYYDHIDTNNVIDPKWLDRVEEVVNYVLNDDMYCIIDVHHDAGMYSGGSWIRADHEEFETNKENLELLWTQIANRFKNYDHNLIFEGINEIVDTNKDFSWTTGYQNTLTVYKLNQVFVDIVRSTGGNNADRLLMVTTFCGVTDQQKLELFTLPNDNVENKIILTVHDYAHTKADIDKVMNRLNNYAVQRNIPVIIGEFGTTSNDLGSEENRAEIAGYYVSQAKKLGITCFWWDDGGNYQLLNRNTLSWRFNLILKALIDGSESEVVDIKTIDISSLSLDNAKVEIYNTLGIRLARATEPGIYLIKVTTDAGQRIVKIRVNKF